MAFPNSGADMTSLVKALLEGDKEEAAARSRRLYESGVGVERIIAEGVESAMSTLDAKCTLEQFNLLEIMLVGRAVMEVMKYLFPSELPAHRCQRQDRYRHFGRGCSRSGEEYLEDDSYRKRISHNRLR